MTLCVPLSSHPWLQKIAFLSRFAYSGSMDSLIWLEALSLIFLFRSFAWVERNLHSATYDIDIFLHKRDTQKLESHSQGSNNCDKCVRKLTHINTKISRAPYPTSASGTAFCTKSKNFVVDGVRFQDPGVETRYHIVWVTEKASLTASTSPKVLAGHLLNAGKQKSANCWFFAIIRLHNLWLLVRLSSSLFYGISLYAPVGLLSRGDCICDLSRRITVDCQLSYS